MSEFSSIIHTVLDLADAKNVVEIGVEYGTHTKSLVERATRQQGRLYCIDPYPKPEFLTALQENQQVSILKHKSLDVMNTIEDADAWLIDGDHNWYTVFHELQNIKALHQNNQKPLLVFLHDVSWPCSRRDCYYDPESIPLPFRQEYDLTRGAHIETENLVDGGFRGCGQFFWATRWGGEKNGVLTAVEDFLKQNIGLHFAFIPAVFGLGIIFSKDLPNLDKVIEFLSFYHQNELLAKLEQNRIQNYLAVIGFQDQINHQGISS